MRIRLGLEVFGHPPVPLRGIHRPEAFRKRPRIAGPAQGEGLVPSQKRFDGAPQPGPEFNLTGNGSVSSFSHESRILRQRIRDFNRLTHDCKVAKRYRPVNMLHRASASPELRFWARGGIVSLSR